MADEYSLYTDGGSRNNPGLAAIGGVLFDKNGKEVLRFKQFIGVATNNIAEYTALIHGIWEAKKTKKAKIENLVCYLDSELVVKQLNGEYRVKDQSLRLLNERVLKVSLNFNKISFNHILRNSNKIADALVNKALNEV